MLKEKVSGILSESLAKLYPNINIDIICDTPKNSDHGDISVNVAMQLAKPLGVSPRVIAENIISSIKYDTDIIQKIKL